MKTTLTKVPTNKTAVSRHVEIKQPDFTPPPFDGYNKALPVQSALGSDRGIKKLEVGYIQSTNWPGAGWRLTPSGIEFAGDTTTFPPGVIPISSLENLNANKLLGNIGASGAVEQIGIGSGLAFSGGNLVSTVTQYTDENAQDAVGGILSSEFTYNDAGNAISINSISVSKISGFDEAAQDAIGAMVDPSLLYVDGTPSLGIASTFRRKSLFDRFVSVGNVGTGEDDLYSDTIAAGQLANNGEKIEAEYGGTFVSSATATRQIRIYFGGTLIFDTGTLTLSLSSAWTGYVTIIRESSSVVRCMTSFATEGAALAAYTQYTRVTGLTLANTQVLKITGEAAGVGAATDDIQARMYFAEWKAAA